MTRGGAIYSTVLASLGMELYGSTHYTNISLRSLSCFQSPFYNCATTFE